MRRLPTKKELKRLYCIENKSFREISELYGYSRVTINKLYYKYGFSRKSRHKYKPGQRIGRLIVNKYIGKVIDENDKIKYCWECICDCGKMVEFTYSQLRKNKSCRCLQYFNEGNISIACWNTQKRNAAKRKIAHSITIDEAWEIFLAQNKKCYFSGLPIDIKNNFAKSGKKAKEFTASLDRLDNNLGYTKENCVWVHKNINTMKSSLPVDEFVALCHLISKKHKTNKTVTISNVSVHDKERIKDREENSNEKG